MPKITSDVQMSKKADFDMCYHLIDLLSFVIQQHKYDCYKQKCLIRYSCTQVTYSVGVDITHPLCKHEAC